MNTVQANAIAAIDDHLAFVRQLEALYQSALDLKQRQTQHDYVSTWKAQPTYAVNADGSQGTADAQPDNGHPMSGVNLTADDLSAVTSYLVADLISFVENVAPTQADRRPAIYKVLP